MSTGLYSHTTRGTGTVLTAAIYNSDHVNHITNQNPSMTGAYSDNVSQMQATSDPGGLGTEVLAGSLAEEIEYLRFAINRIVGKTRWYEAPSTDLENIPQLPIVTADITDAAVTNAKLANMAGWTIKMRNNSGSGVPQDQTINQLSAVTVDLAADQFPVWDTSAGAMGKTALLSAITALTGLDIQTFNSSDTWNKPSKGTIARVQGWGGGAAGGNGNASNRCGGGGGGGAYVELWIPLASLASSVAVTIGAGGSSTGANGGTTTFGSHLTAFGGGGAGSANSSTGGGGGGGGGMLGAGGNGNIATPGDGGLPRSVIHDGATTSVTPGINGGGTLDGSSNVAGGGGGGAPSNNGGDSVFGGAGGGGGNSISGGDGGSSIYGGAGGGGAGPNAGAGGAGGTSLFGGAGGAGGGEVTNGTNGTAPGGGGGGCEFGTVGFGAAGRIIVTVF